MTDELDIGSAGEGDLSTLARIHLAAFPESTLSRLGPEVVRLHYSSLRDGPHDVTELVARAGGEPVGFLVGGVFRGSAVLFITRNRRQLAGAVVTHPRTLLSRATWSRVALGLRLIIDRRRPAGSERPARVPDGSFGVLVLAVVPGARGEGVGRGLLQAGAEHARDGGFTAMHLTTDPGSPAARFYASQGWTPRLEPDGRWEGLMTLLLGPAAPSSEAAP